MDLGVMKPQEKQTRVYKSRGRLKMWRKQQLENVDAMVRMGSNGTMDDKKGDGLWNIYIWCIIIYWIRKKRREMVIVVGCVSAYIKKRGRQDSNLRGRTHMISSHAR